MEWDHEEFAAVFNELYPGLCRFLECLLAGSGQAQEIAQEAFLRLYRKGASSIAVEEVRYWIYRVARNLAINELRKRSTRARLLGVFSKRVPSASSEPDAALELADRARTLLALLRGLPEHQRAALLLREQEEMSYREIARVLNASEGKIKVDIFRARKSLRQAWTDTPARKISNGARDR